MMQAELWEWQGGGSPRAWEQSSSRGGLPVAREGPRPGFVFEGL